MLTIHELPVPTPAGGDAAASQRVSEPRPRAVEPESDRVYLRQYLATWTDGVTRVIHARRLVSARALAAQLEVPPGVFVRSVKALS